MLPICSHPARIGHDLRGFPASSRAKASLFAAPVLYCGQGRISVASGRSSGTGFRPARIADFPSRLDKIRQHKVRVFSSNYALYGDMSRRVMSTLAALAQGVEIYSIHEAFLSLKGFEHRGLERYAAMIRASVKRTTGIPVSIGIGPTKTLATIANRLAKKRPSTDGVFNLLESDVDVILRQVDVADVWGIGRQWVAWLKGQGIPVPV